MAPTVRPQLSANCQRVCFVVRGEFPDGFNPQRRPVSSVAQTGTIAPVLTRLSALASQRIVAAMSAGLLQRATTSGEEPIALRLAGVSMTDGTTALISTGVPLHSSASARVSATTPAFAIVYARVPPAGSSAAREATLTTRPGPLLKRRTASREQRNAETRF